MKRLTACLTALLLAVSCASAETLDASAFSALEGCAVYLDENGVDTVARPTDQPYIAADSAEDAPELNTFLDFVAMPNEDRVFLRLTLSLVVPGGLNAREMTVTVEDRDWCFTVTPLVSEYDGVYYEDYAVCFTDESLPMLKAMARGKADAFAVTFVGDTTLSTVMALPADRASALYNAYADMGGTAQDMEDCRVLWPVTIR